MLLLHRMHHSYRDIVLAELGVSLSDAAVLREKCSLRHPQELLADIATLTKLVGTAVKTEPVPNPPEMFAGSTAHYFILSLWPHLFWVANASPKPGHVPWGVGFQNQWPIDLHRVNPATIRVGLWTLLEVERVADSRENCEGWNEESIDRFVFGNHCYEGLFMYGLLQRWQRVSK